MIKLLAVVILLSLCATVFSQPGPKRPGTWPAGYWPLDKSEREPFLAVDPVVPGKNMYPWGVTKDELEKSFAAGRADRDEVLDQRTVARRVTTENLRDDMAKLIKYPALDTLHPRLKDHLS